MANMNIGAVDPDYGIGPDLENVPEIVLEVERGLTHDDEKRQEKVRSLPNPMQPYEDFKKFNRTIQFAKVYRRLPNGFSEPTLIDATLAGHYLRKRDAEGNPIFSTRMIGKPLPTDSSPCPVESAFGLCGRKLRNNVELLFHIQRVHPSESQFYIRKRLDGITEILFNPFGPDAVVQMTGAPIEAVAELVKVPAKKKTYTEVHTCKAKGRFGHSDASCPRCQELIAAK